MLDQLFQFWSTHTICTVDSKSTLDFSAIHDSLEGCSHLLVVAFFSSLSVGVFCANGIDATNHVVELRGCQDAVVFVLDAQGVKGRFQSFDQIRPGGTSISGENNLGRAFMDLADLINKSLIENGLVGACELVIWGVSKHSGMFFPSLLRQVRRYCGASM